MMIFAGLGNPGEQYARTRHNIGFMVVDTLAVRLGLAWRRAGWPGLYCRGDFEGRGLALIKPATYMNRSGLAVAAAAREWRVSAGDIVAVHDDLDLPPGRLRVRYQGGSGGHRGVASIIAELAGEGFGRVRIGIGRPPVGVPVDYHVLAPLTAEEINALSPVLDAAAEALLVILIEGYEAAMRRFNG